MNLSYVDPMLPRMTDQQLRNLIFQASALIKYRRANRDNETMVGIATRIAAGYGRTVHELRGASRAAPIVRVRQQAFWEIYQTGNYSLPQIGKFFFRHHTTVLAGLRAHERRREAEA